MLFTISRYVIKWFIKTNYEIQREKLINSFVDNVLPLGNIDMISDVLSNDIIYYESTNNKLIGIKEFKEYVNKLGERSFTIDSDKCDVQKSIVHYETIYQKSSNDSQKTIKGSIFLRLSLKRGLLNRLSLTYEISEMWHIPLTNGTLGQINTDTTT